MDSSFDVMNEFEDLRQAGLKGDDMAAMQIESKFGDRLTRLVRRVIRKGRGTGSLAEFILNEAASIRSQRDDLDRDELVSELISRICLVITGKDVYGRVDTVSMSDRQTVIAT